MFLFLFPQEKNMFKGNSQKGSNEGKSVRGWKSVPCSTDLKSARAYGKENP